MPEPDAVILSKLCYDYCYITYESFACSCSRLCPDQDEVRRAADPILRHGRDNISYLYSLDAIDWTVIVLYFTILGLLGNSRRLSHPDGLPFLALSKHQTVSDSPLQRRIAATHHGSAPALQ